MAETIEIDEKPYTLAVVGSRDFKDELWVGEILRINYLYVYPELRIVSGGAPGADTFAFKWAKQHNVPTRVHLADWERHGKAAGPMRNHLIVDDADELIAFWDEKSRGTRSSLEFAREKGIKATVYTEDGREYVYCEAKGESIEQ